jgi:glycosyltransferase involved in cell wall biosynthesis
LSRRSTPGVAVSGAPTRLCWVGTYEHDYPRNRVLIDGLRALGVEVVEVHEPVWERTRHKAGGFLNLAGIARSGSRWAVAWMRIWRRTRLLERVDAVVLGYPAQPDAVPGWLVARTLGAPLVVDAMISFSDTLAGDRGRVGTIAGHGLAGLDRTALALADLVIADTAANADWLTARFGVPRGRIVVVPVGAEPERFPASPPPDGPVHALFYGKLAPLHGLESIVAASRIEGTPPIRLIGEGQLDSWLAAELAREPRPQIEHLRWVPYHDLGAEVQAAAICLGVFGTSDKAGRVVPNKVYQAMSAGRPVVTADTAGIREVITDGVDGLLVPPGDAQALAEALRRLAADPPLRARLGTAAHARFEQIGHPEQVAAAFLTAFPLLHRHGRRR